MGIFNKILGSILKSRTNTVAKVLGNDPVLEKLANATKVTRQGTNHQAGGVFFKMKYSYFEDLLDETKYTNTIYDLAIMYHQCKDHTSKQTYD